MDLRFQVVQVGVREPRQTAMMRSSLPSLMCTFLDVPSLRDTVMIRKTCMTDWRRSERRIDPGLYVFTELLDS